jgi:dephospho-CoA kinase
VEGGLLTVGLTGGIASGKTTIARHLETLGAVCADADVVAHELMAAGTDTYDRLVGRFGRGILAADGAIDRVRLGDTVFGHTEQLEALNRIVHPPVIRRAQEILEEWRRDTGPAMGVMQVPLLIESGMADMFDVVVVVVSSPEQQVKRLTDGGMTLESALARLRSQLTDSERLVFSDWTIINKGDLALLKEQSSILFEKLRGIGDGRAGAER